MTAPVPVVKVGRIELKWDARLRVFSDDEWFAVWGNGDDWEAQLESAGGMTVSARGDSPQSAADALTERLKSLKAALEEIV